MPGHSQPFPCTSLRIRIESNVGDNGRAVGAGCKNAGEAVGAQATDRHERQIPDRPFPERQPVQPLGRPGHLLENRRVDWAERDIIRLCGECRRKFRVIVTGKAELQPGTADGRQVSNCEILLAEMNEIAALIDRDLPVIIDDQLAVMASAHHFRPPDMLPQRRSTDILHPQLHQTYSDRHQKFDPVGAIDDQVKGIELHAKTPLPITGVDGTAMSRGSSMPAG